VADRLRALMRPADTVARLGGDEFVVLCEDLAAGHRSAVAERIRSATAEPIPTSAGPAQVGLSIGMAEAGPEQNAAAILDQADRGMYRDKLSRRTPS